MKFRYWLANKLRWIAEVLCGGAGSPQSKMFWKKKMGLGEK